VSQPEICGRGSPTRSGRTREEGYDNQNDIPVRSLIASARWFLAAIAVPVGPANATRTR